MTDRPLIEPKFPGGMDTAPEVHTGGCANVACLCPVEPGRTFCCLACARADESADTCVCGHFGCSTRAW